MGNFEGASLNSGSAVTSFRGSWSLSYDDNSVVNLYGINFLADIPLTSLILEPNPLGVTLFDTSNVAAYLSFSDTVLSGVFVGGTVNYVTAMNIRDDDFTVFYDDTSTLNSLSWGISTESGIIQANELTGSFTSTPVPLPNTVWLIGSCLFAMFRFSRKQQVAIKKIA
tara:strand:- start:20943 stop:21446 length:504 start_codon:yes stop_codon:yes gene_type:complete